MSSELRGVVLLFARLVDLGQMVSGVTGRMRGIPLAMTTGTLTAITIATAISEEGPATRSAQIQAVRQAGGGAEGTRATEGTPTEADDITRGDDSFHRTKYRQTSQQSEL